MTDESGQSYRQRAARAIGDPQLQKMLRLLQELLGKGAERSFAGLPGSEDLRREGRTLRQEAVENLDTLLEALAAGIRHRGGRVFFAEDAAAANAYCVSLARKHQVKNVVKGKSMVAEEVGLNHALAQNGIEVTETDLGEFIVQLAGEHPSHIIAPAIHKSRQEVGRIFAEKLGIDYTDDPPALTRAARQALREKLLHADMGITGCNLACAETGQITLLSNEGNISMATILPRIHVAIMGMERVTARLADLRTLLGLLTRGASAQKMSAYVSTIGGPAGNGQIDGPDEFHLVILDNGRSRILADQRFREILCCLRCGACLNACPVYGIIGGHAYASPYPGPMGAVVSPLLFGINRHQDLCRGETLCGACKEACPIHIDIPRMLLELRAQLAVGDRQWDVRQTSAGEKIFYQLWSLMIGKRPVYDLFLRCGSFIGRLLAGRKEVISRLPQPLSGWTMSRDLKPLAKESFTTRWKRLHKGSNRDQR
ncbi:MAG: iron-sulfur cluster-binding protein [Deltaproteobacteria bacterium]|nr:iron-sulfur cluster-binding protein [Candidatus Anaeroferrophillus wilburensis]MBN2889828.1 iron-sulfur cluster-binding protein [Deltaproteobacteria bacterium]